MARSRTFNKAKALKVLIAQVTQVFKTACSPFKRGDLIEVHADFKIDSHLAGLGCKRCKKIGK